MFLAAFLKMGVPKGQNGDHWMQSTSSLSFSITLCK